MDTHLNPAVRLYHAWEALLRVYNPDLDTIVAERQRKNVNTHVGYWYEKTTFVDPQLGYNVILATTGHHYEDGEMLISLCYKPLRRGYYRETAYRPMMTLHPDGAFQVHYTNRAALKTMSKHTFLSNYVYRGDLVAVKEGSSFRNQWHPWEIQKRVPYITGRGIMPEVWYELTLDDRGHWRFKIADHRDTERQDALDLSYKRSERLYALRRRRRYVKEGLPDPEAQRIVIQTPDALAKAFPIYRPAPVTFPERKPLEASHG